jgi:hypothetical protein
VTLSTATGLSATLNNLSDGTTGEVVITATDSLGQTADSSFVFGIDVAPVYNETATFAVIQSTDMTAQGSGSLVGNGTFTVGSFTFTVVTSAGSTVAKSTALSSSGLTVAQTGGVSGDVTAVTFPSSVLVNYAACEHILFEALISIGTNNNSAVNVGLSDNTSSAAGNAFGVTFNGSTVVGASNYVTARRLTAGAGTTYTMSTTTVSANKSYAVQVLLFGGRIPLMSVSESTSYIAQPKIGVTQPMQGTLKGGPGSTTTPTGAAIAMGISNLKIQLFVNAVTNITLKSFRFSRYTRPPYT